LVAEGYNPVADATTEEAADRAEETEAEAAADVEDDVVTEAAELAAEDEALLKNVPIKSMAGGNLTVRDKEKNIPADSNRVTHSFRLESLESVTGGRWVDA
jgi:hypothetical protein